MKPRRTSYYVIVAAALLYACREGDRKEAGAVTVKAISDSNAPSLLDSSSAPQRTPRYLEPQVVTDTPAKSASIEKEGEKWVLRLPTTMTRVLRDSLPGFIAHEVVLGDFNGDSAIDVAMDGGNAETSAFFLLLAKSDSLPESRILFAWKAEPHPPDVESWLRLVHPQEFPGNAETSPFTLRTDGVVYGVSDKGGAIYYVEKGVLTLHGTD
jgi:hypothetical protein